MTRHRRPPTRADENRSRMQSILEDLGRAMAQHQTDPDFTGNITLTIPSKAGCIGSPIFEVKRFGRPPD